MKILSVTQGDGRVVELTRQEFIELAKLSQALEGKSENEARWDFQTRGELYVSDELKLDGVFGAILAFYTAKFRANEMRRLVEQFEAFVKA